MNKKIIFSFVVLLVVSGIHAVFASALTDIDSHKNKSAIEFLNDRGVISGYPDGTFQPDKTINRAELLKVLVGGKGMTPTLDEYKNCFPDVKTEWFAPYVCYAKEAGWVSGYSDGTFRPSKTVNKAEAIKMLINSQGYDICEGSTAFNFDNPQWYNPFVCAAAKKGLLEESEDVFNGAADKTMTRAGVGENIYRAIIIKEKALNSFTEFLADEQKTVPEGYVVSKVDNDLFPINLINNDAWEIEVKLYDENGEDPYFYKISRTLNRTTPKDSFVVKVFMLDKVSGLEKEVGKHPNLGAFFAFLNGENLRVSSETRCTYPSLNMGCHSYYLNIPSEIPNDDIVAKEVYVNNDTYESSDFEQKIKIRLIGKNKSENACKVRGIKYSPYNVYYTSESKKFGKQMYYLCFESETAAKGKGYRKASDN